MPLGLPVIAAEARHPHYNGYVNKRGAIFPFVPEPTSWYFDGTQYFAPLKATILRVNVTKSYTNLSNFDIEFPTTPADQKFRNVTPFSQPPGRNYVKWYDARANKQMYLKSRTALSKNPLFGFWLIRAMPPSGTTLNPTVEIELGSNQGTRFRIGLPFAGSQWKYPYLNKSIDGGVTFSTVNEFQSSSAQTRSASALGEETVAFIFLKNEMFIFLNGAEEPWRYKEPALEIPSDYYRVLAQGHVIAFNLTEWSYELSGTVEEATWHTHAYHALISTSAMLRDLSDEPSGTTVSVADLGSSGVSRYQATLTTTDSKVTPILYQVIDEREPDIGATTTTTIDLHTLGDGVTSAEWTKDSDGRSGRLTLLLKNVPLAATLPKEGWGIQFQAGHDGGTGIYGLGLDFWGDIISVQDVRTDETLGVKDVQIECVSIAGKVGETLCTLLACNALGHNWAMLFKLGGRCAGLTNAQMSGVVDSGFTIDKDFFIDPDWTIPQLWDEMVKMRGDWWWGIDFTDGVIYAQQIPAAGTSVWTLDDDAVANGDLVKSVQKQRDLDAFRNFMAARFKANEVDMMALYAYAASVTTPSDAKFVGYWKDENVDVSGAEAMDALNGLSQRLTKESETLDWETQGKRLDPRDDVTVSVSGIGVTDGTKMRIASVKSSVTEDDDFTTSALLEKIP